MNEFAYIYLCPIHGEVTETELVEDIDTERDDVDYHRECSKCQHEVRPKIVNGLQAMKLIKTDEN